MWVERTRQRYLIITTECAMCCIYQRKSMLSGEWQRCQRVYLKVITISELILNLSEKRASYTASQNDTYFSTLDRFISSINHLKHIHER